MKKSLIIGGSNGIGLALSLELMKNNTEVCIIDKVPPHSDILNMQNVTFRRVNLLNDDLSFLTEYADIDTLIITAGFGRIAPFESITEKEIQNVFEVNTISLTKILNFYFPLMKSNTVFNCVVMGSIAGLISSPLFALYGATKAAVCKLIESLNVELEMSGTKNRILNVSPGSIKGTKFNDGENDLDQTHSLAVEIIKRMYNREELYIPEYEEVYKGVINRYKDDSHQFGVDSFNYKLNGGRLNLKPQVKIGYLSGTFDLFHVGHLNLLRRAKQYCDYLVVGVHKDASHKGKETFIPFEERCEIVKHIKFVDKVIESEKEDCDVYKKGLVHYDFLFVGSDYKGTERFNAYEEYFSNKGVQIVYFPYTKGTSSTQIRENILNKSEK